MLRYGRQFATIGATVLLGGTVLAFFGLIGLGRWQLDEYFDFYGMRSGLPWVLNRLRWSPRPISEPFFLLYGWLVNTLHRPLIIPFLAIFWAVFLFAGLFTFRQLPHLCGWGRARDHLLIALTLMALFLAGGHLGEIFYWPAGAVAYIPTLAATLVLFLQVLEGRLETPRGRVTAAICLTIAAGSSEAGATFVLCYIGIRALRSGLAWLRSREPAGSRPPLSPTLSWMTVPGIVTGLVLVTVRMNRFDTKEIYGAVRHSVAGHPLLSCMAAFKETAIELIGHDMLARTAKQYPDPAMWFHHGPGFLVQMLVHSRIPMEILLPAGIVLWYSGFGRISRRQAGSILELCAAFMAASFLTIAAANLHFGFTCCARHELLRECWTVMTITGLAVWLRGQLSRSTNARLESYSAFAPVVLCMAVFSLGFTRPLIQTYRLYKTMYEVAGENYASGFSRASDHMLFWVLPSAGFIAEETPALGVFVEGRNDPPGFSYDSYPFIVMKFFGKDEITIMPYQLNSAYDGVPLLVEPCACSRTQRMVAESDFEGGFRRGRLVTWPVPGARSAAAR